MWGAVRRRRRSVAMAAVERGVAHLPLRGSVSVRVVCVAAKVAATAAASMVRSLILSCHSSTTFNVTAAAGHDQRPGRPQAAPGVPAVKRIDASTFT